LMLLVGRQEEHPACKNQLRNSPRLLGGRPDLTWSNSVKLNQLNETERSDLVMILKGRGGLTFSLLPVLY